MFFENITLPAYIINLKQRPERLQHVLKQFGGRNEFDVTVVEACKHKIGAVGLWHSIIKVIHLAIENQDDVIIICEDDHTFTEHYDRDYLFQNVLEAHEQACDVLCGGIGGFNHAVPLTHNRYWIDSFWCTQFIVVYRKFFKKILNEPYDESVTADDKISEMTSHKMVLYPFISVQHDFGYSDVTKKNNDSSGIITEYFKNANERLGKYRKVYDQYLNKEKQMLD